MGREFLHYWVIATQELAGCFALRPVFVEKAGHGLPTLELR